jgi:hypothetical protein
MLITDQVATAPCTDRVQVRRPILRQARLIVIGQRAFRTTEAGARVPAVAFKTICPDLRFA